MGAPRWVGEELEEEGEVRKVRSGGRQHCSDTSQWDDAESQNPLFIQTHDAASKQALVCFPSLTCCTVHTDRCRLGVLPSHWMFWESHNKQVTSAKTTALDKKLLPPPSWSLVRNPGYLRWDLCSDVWTVQMYKSRNGDSTWSWFPRLRHSGAS